jgi:hypothetical protein
VGRAIAELFYNFGLDFWSTHDQNFMVELDEQWRPTGRIVVYDYQDANIHPEFLRGRGGTVTRGNYRRRNERHMYASVGFGKGGRSEPYVGTFFEPALDAFEAHMARLTGDARWIGGEADRFTMHRYQFRGYDLDAPHVREWISGTR